MEQRKVVVTGVGAISPLGVGAQVLIDRWSAGDCGIVDGVGRCDSEWNENLPRKLVRRTDRCTQMALAAADEAARQAGWVDQLPADPARVACIIGNTMGGEQTFERQLRVFESEGPTKVSPYGIVSVMTDAAAAEMCIRYGVQGFSAALASACASGADSIALGVHLIRAGLIDAAFVGGAEASVTDFVLAGFRKMMALSKSGTCRPFDRRRDGFVLSEGAGVLCVEAEEMAVVRGATVRGRLLGAAATSDANHVCSPDPAGRGAALAIANAIDDSGLDKAGISYVNAHGTSTTLNDRLETAVLKAVLGEETARKTPVSSTKSAIGHTLAAAGALEAIATMLALNERIVPPTLGYEQPDPDCDLDYVPEVGRRLERDRPAVALSNSFGFGGHNVALVIEGSLASANPG